MQLPPQMKLINVDVGWFAMLLTVILILGISVFFLINVCASEEGVGFGESINVTVVRANSTIDETANQNQSNESITQNYLNLFNSFRLSGGQMPLNQTNETALAVQAAGTSTPAPTPSPTATETPAPIGKPDYTTIWIFFGVILTAGVVGLFFWRKAKNDINQKADYGYFRS